MSRRGENMKRQPRSNKRLPVGPENVKKRQRIWLSSYRNCGNVRVTSAATGIARSIHNEWLRIDPEYAEQFELAKQDVVEMLEEEADRRAYHGVRRKKFHPKSKRAYHELEYSDTLLMFRLKALAPEKYRERYDSQVNAVVAHSGQVVIQLPATEPNDS